MSVRKVYAISDAFIYEGGRVNTGLDEILEVGNLGSGTSSRILIRFPEVTEPSASYIMHLSNARASGMTLDTELEIYPVLEDWEEGLGKRSDLLTEGVTWEDRTTDDLWSVPGGTVGTLETAVRFSKTESKDINVRLNSLSEYGYLIKVKGEENSDALLTYYSSDSHTIFKPYLEVGILDAEYSSSLKVADISKGNFLVNISNLKDSYRLGDLVDFRLDIRNQYPERTFTTSSLYRDMYILPENAFWGIKDEYTNTMFVDFSPYTQISADSTGSFFKFYTTDLEPERYYRLLIQVVQGENKTTVELPNSIFKIVRDGER